MKDFWRNHGLWVLFAGAVIAVAMAVLSYFSATSPLVNVAGVVTSPFRTVYSATVGWFTNKQNYFRDITALQEENAELRRQIAEMEEDVRQARADIAENQRFRSLLGFRQQRRDLSDLEPAAVMEHNVSNWTSSLTINKGSEQGIELNDCVLDENGVLVGFVSEVGWNWATILTLVDTDSSLGAKIFRLEELCVASGSFALMEQKLLRLDYLPPDCQLLAGDLIVTSGLGGFVPEGLVIGTVDAVQLDDSGSASYAIVTPRADFDDLTQVFVLKSFEIVD